MYTIYFNDLIVDVKCEYFRQHQMSDWTTFDSLTVL